MNVAWNDIFKLPEAALEGARRVPKAALVRAGQLTRKQERSLSKVRAVEHVATVQRSTVRIAPHVDDEHDIRAVIFLRIELDGASAAYAEIAGIIHPCFPNPTALLIEHGDEVCISVAVTRMSLAEHGATVVEDMECTGGFDVRDSRYAPFLNALAMDNLPQDDLYTYVCGLLWNAKLARAMPQLGFFPQCVSGREGNLAVLADKAIQLTAERDALAARRRNSELTLNETAKLRMKQRDVERKLDDVIGQVRAICQKGDHLERH